MVSAATSTMTCSSIDGKSRKSSCEEVKCELVAYDSLPAYLKDNEFILSYYRCEWPLKQTILSLFSIHNETLNVWTHLIGFIIFLALTVGTVALIQQAPVMIREVKVTDDLLMSLDSILESLSSGWNILPEVLTRYLPQRSSQANYTSGSCYQLQGGIFGDTSMTSPAVENPNIPLWPFITFMCGAMTCLLSSSACHLLSCHSKCYSYTMLRIDYIGISVLIVTSFYMPVYYSFMCYPFLQNLYNGFITLFGLAVAMISLLPVFQTSKFRVIRSLLFFSLAVSGLVPILHKTILFHHQREAILTTQYELLMGGLYVVGVVVYVMRVPERWMPGMFDLVGHSHQLFHLFVIAGACTHYLAGLEYLKWREMGSC